CALGIGTYCVAASWICAGVQDVYVFAASGDPGAVSLALSRSLLAAAAVIVPAGLIGMMLPFLTHWSVQRGISVGKSVATFGSTPAFGMALGALLSGYVLIPQLGSRSTMLLAGGIYLLIAMFALRARSDHVSRSRGSLESSDYAPQLNGIIDQRLAR